MIPINKNVMRCYLGCRDTFENTPEWFHESRVHVQAQSQRTDEDRQVVRLLTLFLKEVVAFSEVFQSAPGHTSLYSCRSQVNFKHIEVRRTWKLPVMVSKQLVTPLSKRPWNVLCFKFIDGSMCEIGIPKKEIYTNLTF